MLNQEICQCFFKDHGGTQEAWHGGLAEARKAYSETVAAYQADKLPMLQSAYGAAVLEQIRPIAQRFRRDFKDVVVFGTGGSSLGGQMLVALRQIPGCVLPEDGTKVHFLDSIDPVVCDSFLGALTPESTGVIVISKSGSTAETLSQFLASLERFRPHAAKAPLSKHFLVITEDKPSPLKRLAAKNAIECVDHPTTIGGRFSVLTAVGLLPALIAGVACESILSSAQKTLEAFLAGNANSDNLPFKGAAFMHDLWKEGINLTVMLPYKDQLASFGMWFRQLWAESLGKEGKGMTPIRAMGPVDQHSQLQLYLDGPKDKAFTLIAEASQNQGARLTSDLIAGEASLDYLSGRTMGDLLAAMAQATFDTLVQAGCPVRLIRFPRLEEETLGALIMHFMIETVMMAQMMGVDAFDQPAVEAGKQQARAYMLKMEAA